MKKDFETFEVTNGKTKLTANIYTDWMDEKGFKPFVGGCGIAEAQKNPDTARQLIFEHFHSDIQWRIDEHNERIKELESLQAKLGDDVFNLARFKVDV